MLPPSPQGEMSPPPLPSQGLMIIHPAPPPTPQVGMAPHQGEMPRPSPYLRRQCCSSFFISTPTQEEMTPPPCQDEMPPHPQWE